MMDNIAVTVEADDRVKSAVEKHRDYIMKETLSLRLDYGQAEEKYDLNGHRTGITGVRL